MLLNLRSFCLFTCAANSKVSTRLIASDNSLHKVSLFSRKRAEKTVVKRLECNLYKFLKQKKLVKIKYR